MLGFRQARQISLKNPGRTVALVLLVDGGVRRILFSFCTIPVRYLELGDEASLCLYIQMDGNGSTQSCVPSNPLLLQILRFAWRSSDWSCGRF